MFGLNILGDKIIGNFRIDDGVQDKFRELL